MAKRSKDYGGLLKDIRAAETKKIKVAITDIDGILRGKYIHKDKFLGAVDSGFGFCNVVFGWDSSDVCYDNVDYTGWHTGYPDANVNLDLATCRRIPWENGVPFVLGEFETQDGAPLQICPRQLLKRVIDRVYQAGFLSKVGCEFEWFNFRETPQSLYEKNFQGLESLTPGMFGYSVLRAGSNREYFSALMDELEEFDVPLEGLHTETGPGVYEAAILYADALEAADRAVLFKGAVKEIAHRFGIVASFMSRWNTGLPGCSGHLHQSFSTAKGEPAFYDPSDPHRMSKTFKSFLAGQMHCLPEILVMFAPNVNSYKRLTEGFWAPTRVAWGHDNRTTGFRVIAGSANSTRLETRVGGSDINPYLAVGAALASGLYGIQNNLELKTDPVTGNAYEDESAVRLPENLHEATQKFKHSALAKELFGAEFVAHYAATREWEWRQSQQAVTDWELKRYFEIV